MFYARKASKGLILLILVAMMTLEIRAMERANPSIGKRQIGLKEKWKFVSSALPISMFAKIEKTISSIEAKQNEAKHWIKE